MAISLKSGSDGGRLDAMEARITRLESDMSEIKSDLKLLLIGFAEIKGALKGMASAEALGELKASVSEMKATTASAEALADLKGTVGELRGTMASGAALAEPKGRVDSLPTMAKMNSTIGIATAVIVILNNWSVIKAWLIH